ncbi:hypothetical protein NX862_05380 [Rhodobacter sp. KR11]|uniref:hypothetical protein n=1 Tax=Rhodobacter sp. KR11 TaxID=2974588 RepID=UPI00222155B8|nr:hypothetical protein [Rhodobacter sp. KR11]MCW1918178.1 hypothetical protein [Rhodobacter sp. KR11]
MRIYSGFGGLRPVFRLRMPQYQWPMVIPERKIGNLTVWTRNRRQADIGPLASSQCLLPCGLPWLKANFSHESGIRPTIPLTVPMDSKPRLGFSDPDLWRLIERADGVGHAESGKVYIEKEPDWGKTTAAVEDKKDWLRNQGWTKGFLFAGPLGEPEIESLQAVPETFMQFEHPHFAPELPLDVSAWRAFEEGHIFRRSSKAAITEWIERNHSAWKGKEPISQSAKERVATVVNWTPTGAAPRLD